MIQKILDIVYPRFCAGCGDKVEARGGHVCWDCFASFGIISSPICSVCGDPADGVIEHQYRCSWCTDHPPSFDCARSAASYRGALKEMLHSFKYSAQMHLVDDLSDLLFACVDTHYDSSEYDVIVSVPLDSAKRRKRGYNQSELLSKRLAGRLGLKSVDNCLLKRHSTRPQVELNAGQRRRNVKGIFDVSCRDWVNGRSFLLVDDVMTTGATVNEVSRTLKDAGAVKVSVVTVARG